MYDAYLGRFVSPDTVVPDFSNPQSLNRYSYVNNRPINFNDPSGHVFDSFQQGAIDQFLNDMTFGFLDIAKVALGGSSIDSNKDAIYNLGKQAGRTASLAVSTYLTVEGAATTVAALAAMGTTGGVGGICALASGGACLIPVAAAEAVEGEFALAGVLESAWGAGSLAYISANPLSSQKGAQFTSKTLFNNKYGRLDVENPNPEQRPGQIHFQQGNNKWIYDPKTNSFFPAKGTNVSSPKWLNDLLKEKDFQNAIIKGLKYLGE
jgi:hypothetical protein